MGFNRVLEGFLCGLDDGGWDDVRVVCSVGRGSGDGAGR